MPTTLDIRDIPLDSVEVLPEHMHRVEVTTESVRALAHSIATIGQLSPIAVVEHDQGYTLVAGHRRLMAARLNLAPTILARVLDPAFDAAWLVRTHENLERTDLSPFEEALAVSDAIKFESLDLPAIAAQLNRSLDWVRNRLDILDWPAALQQAVHARSISLAAAVPLSKVPSRSDQAFLIDTAIKSGVTARTTAAWLQECRARVQERREGDEPGPIADVVAQPYVLKLKCAACGRDCDLPAAVKLGFCQPCAKAVLDAAASRD